MRPNPDPRVTVRAWLAFAILSGALLAAPDPAAGFDEISIRPAAEAPVELLRPASGEVLVSGRETTIEWRPLRDLSAEGILEWEAFLSFDGGRTWPVRATPHLDASVTRFRFTIPMIPSDEVRLMLRFGDERRELGYVLPTELRSAVRSDSWAPPWSARPTLERGETARPGVPGAVLWVEGARDGRRGVTRSAVVRPVTADRRGAVGGPSHPFVVPHDPHTLQLADRTRDPHGTGRPGSARPDRNTTLPALPLLLLLCRRNE